MTYPLSALRRQLDRLDNLLIAGAAAEVTADRFPDIAVIRVGVFRK